jgi:hypothetical protein
MFSNVDPTRKYLTFMSHQNTFSNQKQKHLSKYTNKQTLGYFFISSLPHDTNLDIHDLGAFQSHKK